MTERIVSVAMMQRGVILSVRNTHRPWRHSDLIELLSTTILAADIVRVAKQGFLTSTGRFVDRREGKSIARAAGQLLPRASESDLLFSEDVW